MVTPRSIGGKANRRRARLEGFGDGTIENPLNLKENKKIMNSYVTNGLRPEEMILERKHQKQHKRIHVRVCTAGNIIFYPTMNHGHILTRSHRRHVFFL